MTDNHNDIDVDRLPDDDELFGRVTNMLGANRVKVICVDAEKRIARIPGRMQKKEWIREDDLVIVEPWEWQDEKADIVHRYENQDAKAIEEAGLIDMDD